MIIQWAMVASMAFVHRWLLHFIGMTWKKKNKQSFASSLLFYGSQFIFEQKYLPQRAYEEMMHYYNVVKAVNGNSLLSGIIIF
jgi:hypothetical protein